MSDTPRTNAILTTSDGAEIILHGATIAALAKHARQLERELATAKGLLLECLELTDNWPGIAYTAELERRIRAELQNG